MYKITADCTWGDGPDVLLVIHNTISDEKLFFDLTSNEAIALAKQLEEKALRAVELEASYEGYAK